MTQEAPAVLSSEQWERCRSVIADRFGWSFAESSQAEFHRAVRRASQASGALSIGAYIDALNTDKLGAADVEGLIAELTTGETYFFRDRACFDRLEQELLPALIAARRSGTRSIRIWSAGCSTGEEPYSIAMLVDRLIPGGAPGRVTILATDIHRRSLEHARHGVYREWSVRDAPRWALDRYLPRKGKRQFEVVPRIRERVTFAYLNLVEDLFPSFFTSTNGVDLIVCRNVLMYLDPQQRQQIIGKFHRALVDGGHLIVSPTECSLPQFSEFETASADLTTFYRKSVSQPGPRSAEPVGPVCSANPIEHPQPREFVPLPSVHAESALPHPVALLSPPDVSGDEARARESANSGRWEEARACCESLLIKDRLNAPAYYLLASIELEQGRAAEAIRALEMATYSDPTFALAYFLLGSVLESHGERPKSDRCFRAVLTLLSSTPSDTPVFAGEGMSSGRLRELASGYLGAEHAS